MQALKELVLLLQQHNLHPLSTASEQNSKLGAFYEGISKGKFKTEQMPVWRCTMKTPKAQSTAS